MLIIQPTCLYRVLKIHDSWGGDGGEVFLLTKKRSAMPPALLSARVSHCLLSENCCNLPPKNAGGIRFLLSPCCTHPARYHVLILLLCHLLGYSGQASRFALCLQVLNSGNIAQTRDCSDSRTENMHQTRPAKEMHSDRPKTLHVLKRQVVE